MEQEPRRGRGLAGPIILIALGLLLLLNNLGLLAWSIWEVIFRLWPVLLIIAGLDLILSRSSIGRPWRLLGALVMLLIVLSVVAVSAAFNVTNVAAGSWGVMPKVTLSGGGMVSQSINQPLGDAQRADINLGLGVGVITIRAQSESGGLIEGTAGLVEGEKLLQDFRVDGDTAYYSLRQDNMAAFSWEDHNRSDSRKWDLRLNPEVPMRLVIGGGVGKINLDLAKLQVTDLEVNTGISKTDLTLPKKGNVRATVDGGIGDTTVLIPRGTAARIEAHRGLGKVSVTGNYQQDGNLYQSPGYESAKDRVDLVIKGGIGKITVREYNVQ